MGLDILDTEKIAKTDINPALDRLSNEIIPKIELVGTNLISQINTNLSNSLVQVETQLHDILTKFLLSTNALLSQQDGWTLDITIPVITIKLNKPETK